MQVVRRRRISAVDLRARVPALARALALLLLIAGGIFVGVSYYKMRHNTPFRMKSEAPALSKEITGIINGYEQRITRNDRLYLWLRAARDVTYADGHHELEDVNLQIFPPTGDKPDQITSIRSLYDQKNGLIKFDGNVQVETHDALKVKTESILYHQDSEVAETSQPLTFERENVSGRATGAMVDDKNKRLELRNDVKVTVTPDALKNAKGTEPNAKDAKPAKKLTGTRALPVVIHAPHAVFEQTAMRLTFSGGATAEQDRDVMSGDTLTAILSEKKQLQKIEVRGNSYLRSMDEGHAAEAHSVDMDFFLDADQRLQRAYAARDVRAQTLNADSEMQLNGATALNLDFQAQGERSLLKEMKAEGRSVVNLSAPKSRTGDPRAASKRLTADAIKMTWRVTGKDLEKAEAVGNAELYIEPVQKTAKADRKTLTAPRFDCDFFESGNLARNCTATGGAKAVIDPMIETPNRSTRTITSQNMTAVFARETQDPEKIDAQGDVKFNQKDKNGVAANGSYLASDETVRLRGGEPTVWDSRARTKAIEIDSNTATNISFARGKVQTTYYSQEQTNGAAPFKKVKSPVYILGDRAEVNHDSGVATYSGNSRMWQDDNFVRGDTITLFREQKRMESRGHVQSALYQAKQKNGNSTVVVPVFATAEFMRYSDPDRLLHYETNVDIKQGTDRMTSEVADVYLQKDGNEVERTVAQRNVVLTQPNKRGTGDWCQYTTADEIAILKGNPAHVEDAEQGSTEGNRVTIYRRENRAVADDSRGAESPGRVRSTHKVNNNKKP
ncbi:MAG TPA: LPS export ABC transporter periplasmic protein LptC [Pyrinomonadaceae bacterium]|nr:LPS export ABC transporter periplasmic protein LptC [Pyrinomonadaceae bacterium]